MNSQILSDLAFFLVIVGAMIAAFQAGKKSKKEYHALLTLVDGHEVDVTYTSMKVLPDRADPDVYRLFHGCHTMGYIVAYDAAVDMKGFAVTVERLSDEEKEMYMRGLL